MRDKLERSLADSPLPQLVVGADGVLGAASRRAIDLLGLPRDVAGQSFETVAHNSSGEGLLQLVRDSCARNEPLTFAAQPWAGQEGEPRLLSGGIVPLRDDSGELLGAAVTLDLADSHADQLRLHNDALSRDNTELRSIADELRVRTDELNVVALFLQSVLTSLRGAVVVVDPSMVVRIWNPEAERLWGIAPRVALGGRLTDLELGFELGELTPPIAAGLAGEVSDDVEVAIQRSDGARRPYTVSVTPLLGPGARVHGVTLLFIERKRGPGATSAG